MALDAKALAGEVRVSSARVIDATLPKSAHEGESTFALTQDVWATTLWIDTHPVKRFSRGDLIALKVVLDTFLARAEF